MDLRLLMPALYSSGTFEGHFSVHEPQPVHFVSSTCRAFFITFTLKSPAFPVMDLTSLYESNSMFGCLPVSTSLGERMHMAQSFVGKVLSSWDITPPMLGLDSMRYVAKPLS